MKYRHLFDEALGLSEAETSLLCVLMLRGPQTSGELKPRSERLHAFADTTKVDNRHQCHESQRDEHNSPAAEIELEPGDQV